MNLNEFIENELEEITTARKTMEQFLKTAPRGRLKTSPRTHGKCYYFMEKENGEREYIPLKDIDRAKVLATKSYYYELRRILIGQEEKLRKILKFYDDREQYTLYSNYSAGRQRLLEPFFITPELLIERWKQKPYTANPKFPENKIIETESGDMVRSKSEALILQLLNSYKGKLLFRYEQELVLAPYEEAVYPDFEIISLRTGNVFYWEHVGMLGDSGYTEAFVRKINRYIINGIIPGKNLILTYECETAPFNAQTAKKMIEELII